MNQRLSSTENNNIISENKGNMLAFGIVIITLFSLFNTLKNLNEQNSYYVYNNIYFPKEFVDVQKIRINNFKEIKEHFKTKKEQDRYIFNLCLHYSTSIYPIYKEAKKLGFKVSEDQITDKIMKNKHFMVNEKFCGEALRKFLKKMDITEQRYRLFIEIKLINKQYKNFIKNSFNISDEQKQLIKKRYYSKRHIKYASFKLDDLQKNYKIKPTDEELFKYFSENISKFKNFESFNYTIYKSISMDSYINKYIIENKDFDYFNANIGNYEKINKDHEDYDRLTMDFNQYVLHQLYELGDIKKNLCFVIKNMNYIIWFTEDLTLRDIFEKNKKSIKKSYILNELKNKVREEDVKEWKKIVISSKTMSNDIFSVKNLNELFTVGQNSKVKLVNKNKIIIAYVDYIEEIDFDEKNILDISIDSEILEELLKNVLVGLYEHETNNRR